MIISIIIFYSESKSNQAQFRCIWPLKSQFVIVALYVCSNMHIDMLASFNIFRAENH